MRLARLNYLLIAAILIGLTLTGWLALDRFETTDTAAQHAYNTVWGFSYQNQSWAAAAEGFRAVTVQFPESNWGANAQQMLVSCLMNLKDDTAALVEAERLCDRYRGSNYEGRGWYYQGACRRRLGRLEAAIENLRWCSEQFPGTQAALDAQALREAIERDLRSDTTAGR